MNLSAAIRSNLRSLRQLAALKGLAWSDLRHEVSATSLASWRHHEIARIAAAVGVDQIEILAAEMSRHVLAPDECTVVVAVGNAAQSGRTVFLKNSDKVGSRTLTGQGFHRFKEINVVSEWVSEAGVRIVGVGAAGGTGLKMGVNSAGVIAASNIVRTRELKLRDVSLDDIRAFDRAQILRQGLEYDNPEEAAEWALEMIRQKPMSTPGNVHFASKDELWILEASYDEACLKRIKDDVAVRANAFVWLSHLNDPNDVSSQARRKRALEFLTTVGEGVTAADLETLACDHVNGPGDKSICRHSPEPEDETSLSSMVVWYQDSGEAIADFALGKPCHAWTDKRGHMQISLRADRADLGGFSSGEVWKKFYSETTL